MSWSLVWTIAVGYVAGRMTAYVLGLVWRSVVATMVRHSPRWQALVRADMKRDRELKRRLEG